MDKPQYGGRLLFTRSAQRLLVLVRLWCFMSLRPPGYFILKILPSYSTADFISMCQVGPFSNGSTVTPLTPFKVLRCSYHTLLSYLFHFLSYEWGHSQCNIPLALLSLRLPSHIIMSVKRTFQEHLFFLFITYNSSLQPDYTRMPAIGKICVLHISHTSAVCGTTGGTAGTH